MRASLSRVSVRSIASYVLAIVVGTTLATVATLTGLRNDMYVMYAVLLVVTAALAAGMGPALVVAITAVVGDDVLLTGRLNGVEHWEHLVAFAGVAISIGSLVADRRRRQIEAEDAVRREQQLRDERASILAAVTHDVKSPLAVILGSARQGATTSDSSRHERLFRRIESAGRQAHRLVETLDDLRLFDRQAMSLHRVPNDLRLTVAAGVEQLQTLSAAHELSVVAPPTPVVAEYDEAKLHRVLANLIGNAIKYSPDGGGVDIQIGSSDDEVWVSVRDRGIGVPPDLRQRIFERGFRGASVGEISGTGLGLFISAEIVKMHGGRIDCEEAPEQGSVFRVYLPRADASATMSNALRVEIPREASR
jgi:signal transduction histidine kinase